MIRDSWAGRETTTISSGTLPKASYRRSSEILIRNSVVNGRDLLNLFVVSICLVFSALYELFEWGVAVATGDSAETFLGTQGYIWDTQSDMAMALVGAVLSLMILSRLHDKQLQSFVSRGT